MKMQSVAQVSGRIGELTALVELARNGFAANDITGQDFGLDAVVTVPARPLTDRQISAIDQKRETSWEMTASMVSIQIKNVKQPRLTSVDLQLWSAANVRRPGSCFVIMVNGDELVVLDPTSIFSLHEHCVSADTQSSAVDLSLYPRFRVNAGDGALGRYLTAWGHFGLELTELPMYREGLVAGGMIGIMEANDVVEGAMLINHLEDDYLQIWADSDSSKIVSEIDRIVSAIGHTCSDARFVEPDNVQELASRIIGENTYIGAPKSDRAFGRENRSLPRLFSGEIETFVHEYGVFFDL